MVNKKTIIIIGPIKKKDFFLISRFLKKKFNILIFAKKLDDINKHLEFRKDKRIKIINFNLLNEKYLINLLKNKKNQIYFFNEKKFRYQNFKNSIDKVRENVSLIYFILELLRKKKSKVAFSNLVNKENLLEKITSEFTEFYSKKFKIFSNNKILN